MDEVTFANREAPPPVFHLHARQASDSESSESGGRLRPLPHAGTAAEAPDALAGSDTESIASTATTTPHKRSQSLQDRLFAKCVDCHCPGR